MDLLIHLHRRLQRAVDTLRIRAPAQRIFRWLMRKRYGNEGLVSAIQNGRRWKLDSGVALRGAEAEYDTIVWMRDSITPGDCVIDVGANVGQMTLEAAHLVGPQGQVLAIEPAPGNVAMLQRHVRANQFQERVHILSAACGDQDRPSIVLHVVGESANAIGSGHSISASAQTDDHASTTYAVTMRSIDSICSQYRLQPRCIKIDVEGAELLVLEGAKRTLQEHRPRVRFGFHPFAFEDPQEASDKIRFLLLEIGYYVDHLPKCFELDEYNIA